MVQHAGHLHHAPQLDLAPVAAAAGRAQRRHQLAGFGAKLLLGFEQAAHLFLQARRRRRRAPFPAPGCVQSTFSSDARTGATSSAMACWRSSRSPRAAVWVSARVARASSRNAWLLRARASAESAWKAVCGLLPAPAQHQPRQQEAGDKTGTGQNVLHSPPLSRGPEAASRARLPPFTFRRDAATRGRRARRPSRECGRSAPSWCATAAPASTAMPIRSCSVTSRSASRALVTAETTHCSISAPVQPIGELGQLLEVEAA